MNIKVIVHEEDDGYWAEVPVLPGCFSQGDTLEELRENIKEAIEGYLSVPFDEPVTKETRIQPINNNTFL